MSDDGFALTRRDWLVRGGIALSGLALPTASGGEETVVHRARARLALNENPFGPSSFGLAAIRNQLGEVYRCADGGSDALTREIVARENVSTDQIVLSEILGALGLHLAINGPAGGEFIYSEPGYTARWRMPWRQVEASSSAFRSANTFKTTFQPLPPK